MLTTTLITALLWPQAHAWNLKDTDCGAYAFVCDEAKGTFTIDDVSRVAKCALERPFTKAQENQSAGEYKMRDVYFSALYNQSQPEVVVPSKMWPGKIIMRRGNLHACTINNHKVTFDIGGLYLRHACGILFAGTHTISAWVDGKPIMDDVAMELPCDEHRSGGPDVRFFNIEGTVDAKGNVTLLFDKHSTFKRTEHPTPGQPLTTKTFYKNDYNGSLDE